MTDTEPKSALAPEEWERMSFDRGAMTAGRLRDLFVGKPTGNIGVRIRPDAWASETRDDCHALAALCLYQQPFGFTHDDVRGLRQSAQYCRVQSTTDPSGQHLASAEWFDRLADRIAALLPPRAA